MRLLREGYRTVSSLRGPLLFAEGLKEVGYGEIVTIETGRDTRKGQILQVDEGIASIQVFEGTAGIDPAKTTVWLDRDEVRIPVGEGILGKVLTGRGTPILGEEIGYIEEYLPVTGYPINPSSRKTPSSYIETGISSIDLMNTLVKGQKLPIFSGSGLPANELAAQIVQQARVPAKDTSFMVVFAAMGITNREADFFLNTFKDSGALNKGVFFINLASDSAVERLLTPRLALTVAEFFAFRKGYDVLVILTDMLYYCEALREISSSREEVPGRRGFPGYMYSDLAELYERAGCIRESSGSITQIPIITMPDDDMTHPVVDLSGYITEGQIVLDRNIFSRVGYPPINVLPSLSRLMNKGIGKNLTFRNHRPLADQLYAAYARAVEIGKLRLIVGDEGLTEIEHRYLGFGERFESDFINQGNIHRNLMESEKIAWQCLSLLPESELYRLPSDYVAENFQPQE